MLLDIEGLIAAPLTPFNKGSFEIEIKNEPDMLNSSFFNSIKDQSLNLELIPEYVDVLKKQEVQNAYILGTTGEGVSLNVAERKQVAEAWMKHSNKLNKILCHVGANSISDVKGEIFKMHLICYMLYVSYCSLFSELAAHAESIKIDGIAVLAPMYYKCADIESLVEYLAGKT